MIVPFQTVRALRLGVFALLAAACDDIRPATAPVATATAIRVTAVAPAAAGSPQAPPLAGGRNLAMGTGEGRNPEPFTLEQRLLDGVRRNDRKTIERALELGAPLTAKDDIGRDPVLLAVMDAASLDLVKWLHGKGAKLDEPDFSQRAALSFAAADGHLEIVRYLLDNGAAVDRPDNQQRRPIHHAAVNDRADVIALLNERGADVNVRDHFGDTPLIVACAKGYSKTATMLLERGADPSLRDQEGRTAQERSAPDATACRNLDKK